MNPAKFRQRFSGMMVCVSMSAIGMNPDQASAQFLASNTVLKSNVPLSAFGASSGASCWGYTSPSGREYALMGLNNSLAVVEITNPSSPVIVGQVPHSNSQWCEVATYGHYAYVSNETGGGLDIVSLANVDNGQVTLVQRLTVGGINTVHTVKVDEVSGFLYLNGSNVGNGRLLALSLANPAAPTIVGQVPSGQGSYCHDSQIVTYTSGPYAGKQIAFCCNASSGFDIVDVTNKASMVRMSHSVYPNLSYCHQGWLSEDRKYFYINDETDNVNETVIFNVENLSAPVYMGSYNSGVAATDHNLYVKGQFIYEAEYRAGLRVFCAADPLNPVQVGWLDSYPANDGAGYQGAWNVYPYFPSGLVIISDINSGLFVVDVSAALNVGSLSFSYPQERPTLVNPNGGTTVALNITGQCGGQLQPNSAMFHYNIGDGYVSVPLTATPKGFQATFPSVPCGQEIQYFFSANLANGAPITDPANAPSNRYIAVGATSTENIFADNFETNLGWTTSFIGATAGYWQRGIPVNDPSYAYDPETDGDGSGQAYLTGNTLGNSDVDGGSVTLVSPVLNLTGGNLALSYHYYLNLTVADGVDRLLVEISSNGTSGPWTVLKTHTQNTQGSSDHEIGLWNHVQMTDSAIAALGVSLTNNMRLRFTANDSGTASIVEAGVDGVIVKRYLCEEQCDAGDVTCDGVVNVADLLAVIQSWGQCPAPPASCDGDVAPHPAGDGVVNVADLLMVISNWG